MRAKLRGSRASVSEPRTIQLGDTTVSYTLRRSARRSYALQVDRRGVRLSAPLSATENALEAFVHKHSTWLLDKLAENNRPVNEIIVADGAQFPLLDGMCRLKLNERSRTASWHGASDGMMELWVPMSADPLKGTLKALKARAQEWFPGRVEEYCYRIGVGIPSVRLSSAATRWGSCSLRSGIRLHWRLVHLPPSIGNYVVAHEVAHLLEMNHSPRFWALVERMYPDWRAARAALRRAGNELPVLVAPVANEQEMTEKGVL